MSDEDPLRPRRPRLDRRASSRRAGRLASLPALAVARADRRTHAGHAAHAAHAARPDRRNGAARRRGAARRNGGGHPGGVAGARGWRRTIADRRTAVARHAGVQAATGRSAAVHPPASARVAPLPRCGRVARDRTRRVDQRLAVRVGRRPVPGHSNRAAHRTSRAAQAGRRIAGHRLEVAVLGSGRPGGRASVGPCHHSRHRIAQPPRTSVARRQR
jgi:hypothetical protein